MRKNLLAASMVLGTSLVAGCLDSSTGRSAFQTYAELFGATSSSSDGGSGGGGGGGGGAAGEAKFRQNSVLTIANGSPEFELNIRVAAWVLPSSLTTAEQQDALINGGYVQLTRETALGTAFSLPPGTFVFNGGGVAGAKSLRLRPSTGGVQTTETIELVTPDAVLFFMEPPTSCETVGFTFTNEGFPLDAQAISREGATAPFAGYTGATDDLGIKHMALIDVYQCNPFRPGVFLKTGGGGRGANEYFEGEDIRIDCFTALTGDTAATISITE